MEYFKSGQSLVLSPVQWKAWVPVPTNELLDNINGRLLGNRFCRALNKKINYILLICLDRIDHIFVAIDSKCP